MERFRTQRVEHPLWDKWLAEMNRQLEAKNIIMSEGRINIIDATPIEAAQSDSGNNKDEKPTKYPEASWHVKNDSRGKKRAIYGFSVHTGVDENGFIHSQSMLAAMAANIRKGTKVFSALCCVETILCGIGMSKTGSKH